jgi:large subunit ribosomal protein L23
MSRARAIKPAASPLTQNQIMDVLRKPIISEKATLISEHNKVTFEVAIDSNKAEIKQAVESLFNVTVTAVNTIRVKGKVKRFRGMLGKRKDVKKAIVTLADGDMIDVASGV